MPFFTSHLETLPSRVIFRLPIVRTASQHHYTPILCGWQLQHKPCASASKQMRNYSLNKGVSIPSFSCVIIERVGILARPVLVQNRQIRGETRPWHFLTIPT